MKFVIQEDIPAKIVCGICNSPIEDVIIYQNNDGLEIVVNPAYPHICPTKRAADSW